MSRVTSMLGLVLSCAMAACGSGGGGGGGGDVTPPPPPPPPGGASLAVTTTGLPPASLQEPYLVQLAAEGGTTPYTWDAAPSTSLPEGMSLEPNGLLEGVPTVPGLYSIDAVVHDAAGASATGSFWLGITRDVADLTATPGPTRGTVVLQFTAPTGANNGPVDAYRVYSSIRHLDSDAALAAAAVVQPTQTPGAPGSTESITVSNLEPGQTLQFAVRALRSAVEGPVNSTAASRVALGTPPSFPAGAIARSTSGTLSAAGYYYLTQDISTSGSAFTITASGVTLDLNGHKVTFGTGSGSSNGVVALNLSSTSTVTVLNGKLVQGAGAAGNCHGINFVNVGAVIVSGVEVTVQGTDADGIRIANLGGDVRVDHCTVHCDTQVVTDRHYPGVAAIRVEGALKGAQIDHNLVTSSPQNGIRLEGDTSQGAVLVHHNRVVGTKALVANGYMIQALKPNTEVFENHLYGESRGIHIEKIYEDGLDVDVHDNYVHVQDQPNAEYPVHWAHGIKIEGAKGCKVHHNVVVGVADQTHAEIRAIDLDCQDGAGNVTGIEIRNNRIIAQAVDSTFKAFALHYSEGTTTPPNGMVVRQNVFRATDTALEHYWDNDSGGLMQENAFERDLSLGTGHAFHVETFDTSDTIVSLGHRLLDSLSTENLLDVAQWPDAASFESTREWTLKVIVRDGGGLPVDGATVTVKDKNGATAFTATSDPAGTASGTVTQALISNNNPNASAKVTTRNPFSVTATKSGVGSYTGSWTITGRTAVVVNLPAGTASLDATPPSPVGELRCHAVSASRVDCRWAPASDGSGVPLYRVYMDGDLVGITDQPRFMVSGLAADSAHTFEVEALDAASNPSGRVSGSATTRPEDRGP